MPATSPASRSTTGEAPAAGGPESVEAVLELLAEAGVVPQGPRALLEAPDADPQAARLACVRRLMAHVRDTDETAYVARTRELAFLANTLAAGCSVQSRPFTPEEASVAAAGVCNLGLEYWPARWPGAHSSPQPAGTAARPGQELDGRAATPPDSLLIQHDLVTAFEVGWSVLHHDVGLFAAEQLISTLTAIDCVDRDIRRGLVAFRRALVAALDARAPWHAREAAEVLATFDMTAWIGVLGLLDECPILPAALTAIVERRKTTVSPTAFDFISTAAQIGDVRVFLHKLPDLL